MLLTDDTDEFKRFRKLVRKMRKAQRHYWAGRNPDSHRQLLTERRYAAELTRPQLARLAGVAGETVRRIELGLFTPHPRTAAALARALDMDVLDLWISEDVAA